MFFWAHICRATIKSLFNTTKMYFFLIAGVFIGKMGAKFTRCCKIPYLVKKSISDKLQTFTPPKVNKFIPYMCRLIDELCVLFCMFFGPPPEAELGPMISPPFVRSSVRSFVRPSVRSLIFLGNYAFNLSNFLHRLVYQ